MRCPFNRHFGRFLGALELTPWAGALSEWGLWDVEEGGSEAVTPACNACKVQ